jgi:hypothetical protein
LPSETEVLAAVPPPVEMPASQPARQ